MGFGLRALFYCFPFLPLSICLPNSDLFSGLSLDVPFPNSMLGKESYHSLEAYCVFIFLDSDPESKDCFTHLYICSRQCFSSVNWMWRFLITGWIWSQEDLPLHASPAVSIARQVTILLWASVCMQTVTPTTQNYCEDSNENKPMLVHAFALS